MREKVTNLQDTFYQPGAIYSINKISDHSGIIAILWENIDVGWIGRYLGENKTKPFKYPIRRNRLPSGRTRLCTATKCQQRLKVFQEEKTISKSIKVANDGEATIQVTTSV